MTGKPTLAWFVQNHRENHTSTYPRCINTWNATIKQSLKRSNEQVAKVRIVIRLPTKDSNESPNPKSFDKAISILEKSLKSGSSLPEFHHLIAIEVILRI